MKKNFIPNTNRYKVGSDMPDVFRRACTLKTIVARCKKYRCHATLTDAAGFVRGYVDPSGDWRLQ